MDETEMETKNPVAGCKKNSNVVSPGNGFNH